MKIKIQSVFFLSQKNNFGVELTKNKKHDKLFHITFGGNFMKPRVLSIVKGFLHLLNFITLGVVGLVVSLLLFLISLVIGLCGYLLGLCAGVINHLFSSCLSEINFFYHAADFLKDEFISRYVCGVLGFVITGGLLMPFKYVKNKINEIGYYETQNERFNNIKAKFDLKLELKNETSWNDDFGIEIAKTKGNIMPLVRSKSFDFDHARKLSEP